MTNAEVLVNPVYGSDEVFCGVAADRLSLCAMESVLFVVQNIAEHRDPTTVLDGGNALGPRAVYVLRETLWDSARDADEQVSGLGFLDVDPATTVSEYLSLLQATGRNRRTFERAHANQWAHWQPSQPPARPAVVPKDVSRLRLFRRQAAYNALARYEDGQVKWLEREMTYKQKLLESELEASRGFEAAAVMRGIVRAALSPKSEA